jgi:hypothetical protein
MYTYIKQAIANFLNDNKDPFDAGDLLEVKEIVEYVEVKTPQTTQKKTRAKAIVNGKYAKQKGEKVADWRRRIIPKYNEIKHVNYSSESKFYTTARINNFIKEIEEIESKDI